MIKFYNTYSRKKEDFTPNIDGEVKLYTCGPTVYNHAHIGNFRAYMFEDLLRRFLESKGFNVTHIMNITDIDDKTIRRSIEEKIPFKEFTEEYTNAFFTDVKTLNILPASKYPKATDTIPQMIDMVQTLVERETAYQTQDGSVFFSIAKFPEYGKLANLKPEQMLIGDRVENDEYDKGEVRDFCLWKARKPEDGDVYWDSPWGEGRPGWHLECSAISSHYLGNHFDIHCGGVDNIFPHHENEIAQSCAATGEPFVNYWLHNEHLLVENKKMSKSLGNFYTLRDLLDMNLNPMAIRYTLLATHYRQKLNFSIDKVHASQKSINRLLELKRRFKKLITNEAIIEHSDLDLPILNNFLECLGNDLNIASALGCLYSWVGDMFNELDKNNISEKEAVIGINTLKEVDKILGVMEENSNKIPADISALVLEREDARESKNWNRADEIRDELGSLGYIIEDTIDGAILKKK